MKKFFSNCGLYYYDNEISNSDDEIDVMIHTPLPESQVSLNFAILIDNFVNMCRLHLNEKIFNVTFFEEGSGLWLYIRKYTNGNEYEYDYNKIGVKRSNAIDI